MAPALAPEVRVESEETKSSYLATFQATGVLLSKSMAALRANAKGCLTHALVDRLLKELGDGAVRVAKARLRVEGLEHLDPDRVYLYMSNHESVMDIPLIFAAAPRAPRMVTKAELFKVPIWGPALKVAGFIAIDRTNRAQAIKSLASAKATMESGINVWIAPEGTRSRDGSLLPFKKGGFMLALETGATIMPVGIVGARNIVRPKSLRSYLDQDVVVRFGEPIDASGYTLEQREELMARVRSAIEALRGSK